jgi:hypothetical protein
VFNRYLVQCKVCCEFLIHHKQLDYILSKRFVTKWPLDNLANVGIKGKDAFPPLFPEISVLFFHIFRPFLYYLVNTVIGTKSVAEIGRNIVGLLYRPFSDWTEKFGNFSDFPHCSSGLSCTVCWACYPFPFNPNSFQIFK